jgi:hypothetical protein
MSVVTLNLPLGEVRLRRFLAVAVVGGGLMFAAPSALADGLFRGATEAEQRTVPGDVMPATRGDVQVLRSALLVVDPHYFRSHLAPPDTARLSEAERNAAASRLMPDLKMQLFPDITLEFERTGVLASLDVADNFHWSGWSKSPRKCDIEIAIQSGVMSGASFCPDVAKAYFVNQIDGNLYRVIEAVMPQVPDDGDDTFNPDVKAN